MAFAVAPIKFGTDGWRGRIAAEFTFERLVAIVPLAAQVLSEQYGAIARQPQLIFVGYDRRFLAEEFARIAAETLAEFGFAVRLADSYAPTPALSWAAKSEGALGALVITASHNPANYLGLKVKSAFGGSVPPAVTQEIEARLGKPLVASTAVGSVEPFDPWASYCAELRTKVDVEAVRAAIAARKLGVYVDAMHGAAAGGLQRLLGEGVEELNGTRDPLFGGHPPEPLPPYIPALFQRVRTAAKAQEAELRVGLVFDGDCDRIAAVDGEGNFRSSQVLIPVLIDHLATRRSMTGEVVKTVSGSDLIPRLVKLYGLPLHETPIGFKYIADRMLATPVLVGGEESGGIGYGTHTPERDALLSALYVLEAVLQSGQDVGAIYARLQEKVAFATAYDRVDLPLAGHDAKERVRQILKTQPPAEIAGQSVVNCLTTDGFKFRLADDSWLLVRFSGTEPLLRLYCEASNDLQVRKTLDWAKSWASEL
ncbi:phosphomannomutase [Rubidibacter lacunae KORDI 51-2]|uniref:Phosphomannomutase n=1 Tax=Rubidibacter lacunae KORDI 51-2 TaxID=582515 RepID=U5D5B7_9CHRO|nr:phosphoglucomutase/phosphomannomutase family protein [Rubidibacter lacunae]ERN39878.1 phosphomannomutase [Rubidibacter lacunae KORDI 51-2]